MPILRLNRKRLRHHVRQGGVIAYPTESCFGLGCDPRNRRALGRVLQLKRRVAHKGLIVIAAQATQFGRLLAPEALAGAREWTARWPAALTLLLPRGPASTFRLAGRHGKLAVRVPDHATARLLCHVAGMPLVSTSANRAGCPSLRTARACRRQFGRRVLVVDGRIGRRRKPSTIIDPEQGHCLR